eukprot:8542660-Alexandrium_andersonii.AAC.1
MAGSRGLHSYRLARASCAAPRRLFARPMWMVHTGSWPRRVPFEALCAFGAAVTLGTWRAPEVNGAASGLVLE